jgi:SAM-dependent methyltransferase
LNSDTWLYWYWGREGQVEDDIPKLSEKLRDWGAERILDLGCGTGRHTIYLAEKGFRVYGFDQSESAIKRAAELVHARNLSADLQVWNMATLPYPYSDSDFDAIVTIKVIHHAKLDTIKRIITEIERITKRGGYLYIQVPTEEKAKRLVKAEELKCEEVEERTYLPLGGDEAGILHHYFTKEELLSLFQAYEPIDLHVSQEHYCLTARKE